MFIDDEDTTPTEDDIKDLKDCIKICIAQLLDLPGRLDGEHLQPVVSQSNKAYQKGATLIKLQFRTAYWL